MNIAYYITSHGYGHGVRTCAICNAFSPSVNIFLRTSLPERFFREEIARPFTYCPAAFDCGCIQSDGVTVDIPRTTRTYREIADANASRLDGEVAWITRNSIDAVVSDITPFALEVAAKTGVPSIAATNFTWYDIYADYVGRVPDFAPYVEQIRRQYESAGLLLAMSPANDMRYFPRIKAVPPVGRTGRSRRPEICGRYGFSRSKRIALIYVGEFGIGNDFSGLSRFTDWKFLGLHSLPQAPSNYRMIDKAAFSYQDLTASANLVISKIGYGTVAECMLNGAPLLYLPRPDFSEYPVLEKAVREWGNGYCLSKEAYIALDWEEVLDAVASRPRPQAVSSDGAKICAREIETFSAAFHSGHSAAKAV
jgi:L-arabinokinase